MCRLSGRKAERNNDSILPVKLGTSADYSARITGIKKPPRRWLI